MIGRTLGNYRIIEQIGLGGMATVFKGYDPDTDRYVAVKILPQHFSGDPQFRQRFQREAKAIAKLEHIHILPIFTYGEDDGISYMAMRYLQAGTLTDRIGEGALPFDEASRVLNQLASALDYAHAHGILHRDMKPSNVLLDDDGNAYLMDFGLAKIVEATVDLTGDRLLGTPAYMSPEQCKGEPVGPATDIYSLGIILYEMVTGRRPFHAETPIAVILQQLNDPLPPPRSARPDLPGKAENVIFKALAKNPESRYETAGDLAAAFARAIAEADTAVGAARPIPIPEPPPPTPAPEVNVTAVPAQKRRLPAWAWGIIGVVAAVVLITLGVALSSSLRDSNYVASESPLAQPQAGAGSDVEPTAAAGPEPAAPESTNNFFRSAGQDLGGFRDDLLAVGDLDGDGDPDAIVGNRVWLNDGSGRFSQQVGETVLPDNGRALTLGDLDGDGDLDAFVAYGNRVRNQVWLNVGDGRFQITDQSLGSADSWQVDLGDIDGDGDLDAVVSGDQHEIWLNDGGGAFANGVQDLGGSGSRAVVLADLNGDGYQDAFFADCSIWLSNGDGSFRDNGQNLCVSDNVALALGDLDGDGDMDAFIGDAIRNANQVWFNDGDGSFSFYDQWLGNSSTEAVALGDLDGDGYLDAFVGNTTEFGSDPADRVWLNDGAGNFKDSGEMIGNLETFSVALADLDGDGDLDALSGNANSSQVWLNQLGPGNKAAAPLCEPGQTQLFFDDFEDGIWEGWDFTDVDGRPSPAGWHIASQEENYVLIGTDHNWASPQNTFGQDYTLSLRVRAAPESTGMDFHINLRMSENGRYLITDNHIRREPGGEMLAQWNNQPDDRWHDLSIHARGKNIKIMWDGRQVAAFDDPDALPGGSVALENLRGSTWYDDILLCAIPPDQEPPPDAPPPPEGKLIDAHDIVIQIAAENQLETVSLPAWSPDGRQIAFGAVRSGEDSHEDARIYIVNADGSGLKQLPAIGNDLSPAWSPNGQWLAFHSSCDLVGMRLDGSDDYWIDGEAPEWCVAALAWSPDSQWLVYTAQPGAAQDAASVRRIVLTTEGGEAEHLMDISANSEDCFNRVEAAFSPDGSQIAYVDGACQPQLLDISTRQSKPIDDFPFNWTGQWYPQWAEPAIPAANLRFTDNDQIVGESGCGKPSLGDLNGDGALDAFIPRGTGFETWLNDGRARFDKGNDSRGDDPPNVCGNEAALGDLDGDGDLDALVGIFQNDSSGGDNIVWLNDGGGSFTDSGQRLGGSHSWAIALGDFDSDGDLDAFDASGGPSKVWLNEGDGRFRDSAQSLGDGDSVWAVLGDLDGDGDLDVFVANFGQGEPNKVFLNDGNGRFRQTAQALGNAPSIGVALGDLDGDGDLDAFVANGSNGGQPNAVWWNEGDGRFTHSGQLLGDSDSWAVALGDLDGDGDLDAFAGNGPDLGGQANTIWLNDGSGQFSDSGLRLGNSRTHNVVLADLDGDGDLDAFAFNEGGNRVWLNQTGED